jgi:hypothetical protein
MFFSPKKADDRILYPKGTPTRGVNESKVTCYLFGEQMQPAVPLYQAESLSAESVNKANLKRLTKAELNEMANSYLCSYEFYCLVRRELEGKKPADKGKLTLMQTS